MVPKLLQSSYIYHITGSPSKCSQDVLMWMRSVHIGVEFRLRHSARRRRRRLLVIVFYQQMCVSCVLLHTSTVCGPLANIMILLLWIYIARLAKHDKSTHTHTRVSGKNMLLLHTLSINFCAAKSWSFVNVSTHCKRVTAGQISRKSYNGFDAFRWMSQISQIHTNVHINAHPY